VINSVQNVERWSQKLQKYGTKTVDSQK